MNILTAKVAKVSKNAHMGKMPRRKRVMLKGHEVTLYSIGWLAYLTSKHPHTIRQYESRKILPPPLLVSRSRKRWYLAEEISGYAAIIKATPLRPNVSIEKMGLREALFRYRLVVQKKLDHNIKALQETLKQEKDVFNFAQGMRGILVQQKIKAISQKAFKL